MLNTDVISGEEHQESGTGLTTLKLLIYVSRCQGFLNHHRDLSRYNIACFDWLVIVFLPQSYTFLSNY